MNEKLYMIALTQLPRIGLKTLRELLDIAGSATALYDSRRDIRDVIPDASQELRETFAQLDTYLPRSVEEMEWAEKCHIQCLSYLDDDYPHRLKECDDAPMMLYYRGNADLNSQRIISMVGTRRITEYGKEVCDNLVSSISQMCPDAIIFSGLAYGVDIHCHRASLKYGLDTVGVLAHGLDQIYPTNHRNTAVEMASRGGLLTEFMSHTAIDKRNFVQRNRIVAGCSDAVIVVESAERGGSLITASLGEGYYREVFAVPGRITDVASRGCNMLIAQNKATPLLSAVDLMETMGWQSQDVLREQIRDGIQQQLFPDLSDNEQKVLDSLRDAEGKQLSQLLADTHLPVGELSSILFNLEMKGVVKMMAGNRYKRLMHNA